MEKQASRKKKSKRKSRKEGDYKCCCRVALTVTMLLVMTTLRAVLAAVNGPSWFSSPSLRAVNSRQSMGTGPPLLFSLIALLPPNKTAFYTNEKSITAQHDQSKFTPLLIMAQNVFSGF
jgi:hypothetical protein